MVDGGRDEHAEERRAVADRAVGLITLVGAEQLVGDEQMEERERRPRDRRQDAPVQQDGDRDAELSGGGVGGRME